MKKWFVSIAMVLVAFLQGCMSAGVMKKHTSGPGCSDDRTGVFFDLFSTPSMPCVPSGPVVSHAAVTGQPGAPYVIINNIPGNPPGVSSPGAPSSGGPHSSYWPGRSMVTPASYGGYQSTRVQTPQGLVDIVPTGRMVEVNPSDLVWDPRIGMLVSRSGQLYYPPSQ